MMAAGGTWRPVPNRVAGALARVGMDRVVWEANRAAGLKWCYACREWRPVEMFSPNPAHADGLTERCHFKTAARRAAIPPAPPIAPEHACKQCGRALKLMSNGRWRCLPCFNAYGRERYRVRKIRTRLARLASPQP